MIDNKDVKVGAVIKAKGKSYIIVSQTKENYLMNKCNQNYYALLTKPIVDLYCLEDNSFEPFVNTVGTKLSTLDKDIVTTTVLKIKLMGRAMPVGFNIYDYKGKYIEFHREIEALREFFVMMDAKDLNEKVLMRYVKEDELEFSLCKFDKILDVVHIKRTESDIVDKILTNGYINGELYIKDLIPIEKKVRYLDVNRVKEKFVDKVYLLLNYLYQNKKQYQEEYLSLLIMYTLSYSEFKKNFLNKFIEDIDIIKLYENDKEVVIKDFVKEEQIIPLLKVFYRSIQNFFEDKNIIKHENVTKLILLNCTFFPYLEERDGKCYPKERKCEDYLNTFVLGNCYCEPVLGLLSEFYDSYSKSEFLNIFRQLCIPRLIEVIDEEDYRVEKTKEGIRDVLSRYL